MLKQLSAFFRPRTDRSAELEAIGEAVTERVLAQVREMLSLELTTRDHHPNATKLNAAVRNIDLISLNIKAFGYDLARQLAAAVPPRTNTAPVRIGLRSKPSVQADLEADWAAHWCAQLHCPVVFHRKIWEFCFVLQALHEAGLITPGSRGLGFGCGQEPIPSYLAAHGVAVTVTDQAPEAAEASGWTATGQYTAGLDLAFQPHLVDRATFDRLVSFQVADMNAIDDTLVDYDFCWSICALEHLGSLDAGARFVENSLKTLRPGGISVHTTEFNIRADGPTIDHWPTVLFQRSHFEALAERLRAQGHEVAPLDFETGDKPMDRFIDLPPWGHDLPADFAQRHGRSDHLKVSVDGFPATCFGLLVRKAG